MKNQASQSAIRAIIAILIRQTIGRFVLLATLVALLITILSGYVAWRGESLLWIITTLTALIALVGAVISSVVYFVTSRIMPRKLKSHESRFISSFTSKLTKKLILLKAPLPLIVWNLFLQVMMEADHSKHKNKLEQTITRSHTLNDGFRQIRSYFE